MSRPVEGLCLCLLLGSATVLADEPAPAPELLEFLGEWSTDDGGWVDPESLAQADELDADDGAVVDEDGHVDAK